MPPAPTESFELFWKSYPRRVAKADARKAWIRLNPSPELVALILDALTWQCQSEAWLKDDGQYVPYAATYLRGERWEDEPPSRIAIGSGRAAYAITEAQAALTAMTVGGERDRRAEDSPSGVFDATGDRDERESRPSRLRAVC